MQSDYSSYTYTYTHTYTHIHTLHSDCCYSLLESSTTTDTEPVTGITLTKTSVFILKKYSAGYQLIAESLGIKC